MERGDTSLHANRLKGEWTFDVRVAAKRDACSPDRLEGANTRTTVTIFDSVGADDFSGRRSLKGSTPLSWGWLGRGPMSDRQGRFRIRWADDSTVSFSIDYFMTHNGGMYGWGRWFGDSIVGNWEQAGYCPTPSGVFVLRRASPSNE